MIGRLLRCVQDGCRHSYPAVLQEHYPDLMQYVRVRVVELMDHVLSTYDRKIGEFTAKQFKRTGMLDYSTGAIS